MHNLACLVEHLHLFLRIAVIGEHVDLWDDIICQLVRELLHRHRLTVDKLLVLLLQLGHGSGTGATGTLIGRDADALDVAQLLERLQHHHHHDGRAVRIGNDATRAHQCILGIALGNNQRHVGVHAEGTAVVDHHTAMLRDGLGEILRGATAGRYKGHIDVLEVIVMLQELHFVLLTTELIFTAGAALRAEENQLVNREIALSQNAQELLSYGTACANNCYFHCLLSC